MALEQLQACHMQLGGGSSDNAAKTNTPSFPRRLRPRRRVTGTFGQCRRRNTARSLETRQTLVSSHPGRNPTSAQRPTAKPTTSCSHIRPRDNCSAYVESFLRHFLDFYACWALHVSPQHHRMEIVQLARPGLYGSTATGGGTAAAVNVHQVALSDHAS